MKLFSFERLPLILGIILIQTSCSPFPMTAVLDPVSTKNLAATSTTPSKETKVSITGNVLWGGKPAPIANGYFKKRVKNALATIPGFIETKESEADLKIHIQRNNKWDSKSMNDKVRKMVRKESTGEAVVNNYDHFFTITGNGSQWSGNVPHTMYMIMGDPTSAGINAGKVFSGTTSDSGGTINFMELKQGDEVMVRQVLLFALSQAKKSGCYK